MTHAAVASSSWPVAAGEAAEASWVSSTEEMTWVHSKSV